MTPLRRASLVALGLLLVALGLCFDAIHPGGNPGIGPFQALLCMLGCAVALLGALPAAVRPHYGRGLLALAASYASAFVAELIVAPPVAHWGLVTASQRGMVQPSSWGGYELTPGWRGRYEDGVLGADVEINALGDRDDLPSQRDASAAERVLLLGDSFTFGWGLEKPDTVEGQIERESGGRAVAYNLGVGGYGPPDTLAHYRERAAFPATHTFFLLYGNDLRVDNCTPAVHTAAGGVLVPRRTDGAPYSAGDVEQRLARVLQEDADLWIQQLKRALLLTQLRARLVHVVRNDYPLATGPADQYTPECALAAAARADEMRAIAHARGQQFAVVVIPTPGEALLRTYHERMQACIAELRRRSIPVLEVRDRLEPSDFFVHHEHLNASGTHKVARAILASVEAQGLPHVGGAVTAQPSGEPALTQETRAR
jgi:hypothetical protein